MSLHRSTDVSNNQNW